MLNSIRSVGRIAWVRWPNSNWSLSLIIRAHSLWWRKTPPPFFLSLLFPLFQGEKKIKGEGQWDSILFLSTLAGYKPLNPSCWMEPDCVSPSLFAVNQTFTEHVPCHCGGCVCEVRMIRMNSQWARITMKPFALDVQILALGLHRLEDGLRTAQNRGTF